MERGRILAHLDEAREINGRITAVLVNYPPAMGVVVLLGVALDYLRHDAGAVGFNPSPDQLDQLGRIISELVGFDPDAWLSGQAGRPDTRWREGGYQSSTPPADR